jgi:hypothetical protein
MLESNTRGYARRSSGASLGDLPFCGRRISFSRRSCEPFFQLTFFGGQSDGQQLADFLVQLPQLVNDMAARFSFLLNRYFPAFATRS